MAENTPQPFDGNNHDAPEEVAANGAWDTDPVSPVFNTPPGPFDNAANRPPLDATPTAPTANEAPLTRADMMAMLREVLGAQQAGGYGAPGLPAGVYYPDAIIPPSGPVLMAGQADGNDESVRVSGMEALAGVIDAVRLVLAWQSRTDRGLVLPLAERMGLLAPGDGGAHTNGFTHNPYDRTPYQGQLDAHNERVNRVNGLYALLGSVPKAVTS